MGKKKMMDHQLLINLDNYSNTLDILLKLQIKFLIHSITMEVEVLTKMKP